MSGSSSSSSSQPALAARPDRPVADAQVARSQAELRAAGAVGDDQRSSPAHACASARAPSASAAYSSRSRPGRAGAWPPGAARLEVARTAGGAAVGPARRRQRTATPSAPPAPALRGRARRRRRAPRRGARSRSWGRGSPSAGSVPSSSCSSTHAQRVRLARPRLAADERVAAEAAGVERDRDAGREPQLADRQRARSGAAPPRATRATSAGVAGAHRRRRGTARRRPRARRPRRGPPGSRAGCACPARRRALPPHLGGVDVRRARRDSTWPSRSPLSRAHVPAGRQREPVQRRLELEPAPVDRRRDRAGCCASSSGTQLAVLTEVLMQRCRSSAHVATAGRRDVDGPRGRLDARCTMATSPRITNDSPIRIASVPSPRSGSTRISAAEHDVRERAEQAQRAVLERRPDRPHEVDDAGHDEPDPDHDQHPRQQALARPPHHDEPRDDPEDPHHGGEARAVASPSPPKASARAEHAEHDRG